MRRNLSNSKPSYFWRLSAFAGQFDQTLVRSAASSTTDGKAPGAVSLLLQFEAGKVFVGWRCVRNRSNRNLFQSLPFDRWKESSQAEPATAHRRFEFC